MLTIQIFGILILAAGLKQVLFESKRCTWQISTFFTFTGSTFSGWSWSSSASPWACPTCWATYAASSATPTPWRTWQTTTCENKCSPACSTCSQLRRTAEGLHPRLDQISSSKRLLCVFRGHLFKLCKTVINQFLVGEHWTVKKESLC